MSTFTKEHKWLLISCLQKSIRRGHEILAQRYAKALLEIERGTLLYRLSIIAIEDVGLGNIDLVEDFLSTRIKKDEIAKRGGDQYLLEVTKNLALSTKDRSACDLVTLGTLNNLSNSTSLELNKVYLNSDVPLKSRLMAGWEILGASKLKNNFVSNQVDNLESFLEINKKLGVHEKVLNLIEDAYIIHREPHFIAIGLLSHLFEKEKQAKLGKFETGQFIEKDFGEPQLFDNLFLIEGIDWHTREGKSAIYDFVKTKPEIVSYLKDNGVAFDNVPDAIGKLLFRHSGHQVNKRLIYPSAVVILKLCQSMEFQEICQNSNVDFSEAIKIFEQDIQGLNQLIKSKFKKPDPRHFPF